MRFESITTRHRTILYDFAVWVLPQPPDTASGRRTAWEVAPLHAAVRRTSLIVTSPALFSCPAPILISI
jgi:hypothetical protein